MLELKGQYNKDCKIFTDNVENEALSVVYKLLDTKELADSPIRCMPDIHMSTSSAVVGMTIPIKDYVNPEHVSVDIGCTVSEYFTDADINPEYFEVLEHRVRKEIPMGFEINDKRQFDMKDFYKFLQSFYDKARVLWPEMINDFDISEKGISEFCKRINLEEATMYHSIMSTGGSNHGIEFGDANGKLAFMIHCGSRNLGTKVCRHWAKIASSSQTDNKRLKEEISKVKKTIKNRTERENKIAELKKQAEAQVAGNGYLTGENMKGYITDIVIATAYAQFNHKVIADRIADIVYRTCKGKVTDKIVSIHNYIDFEDHILRKGAIRAYKDELIVVPLSMKDGVLVCKGKSNPDWNFSCSHGAGRRMSRAQAKKNLSIEEYKKEMEGIYSTRLNMSTIDESPMAYKDPEEIKDLISETCEILYTIKPVINIKPGSSDGEE